MPGVAVKRRDRAGGAQLEQAHDWFVLETNENDPPDPVVTLGDRVEAHGDDPPHSADPVMIEGESWFTLDDAPVCRAEHLASCGDRTTGRYWFQLESAQNGFRPYRTDPSDPCNIEHIPWIMRAQGWHVGAQLMDNWFERPASRNAAAAQDYTTVTMDFVLGFAEGRLAYDDLTKRAYRSQPALNRLCDQLGRRNLLLNVPTMFDDFLMRPHEIKAAGYQIDNIEVGGLADLNDLGASLGEFELFLIASGEVQPMGNGVHKITIRRLGVFAEDSYDFEGIGPTGFKYFPFGRWDAETNEVSRLLGTGCFAYDDKFNAWRDTTIAAGDGRGGDIMIYTEIKAQDLDQPYEHFCIG